MSYFNLSVEQGISPRCRLCSFSVEHTQHILTECSRTAEKRQRIYSELLNLISDLQPSSGLLDSEQTNNAQITQFILDPSSMNLPSSHRISFQHPRLPDIFRISRDWCHSIYSCRARLLKGISSTCPFSAFDHYIGGGGQFVI